MENTMPYSFYEVLEQTERTNWVARLQQMREGVIMPNGTKYRLIGKQSPDDSWGRHEGIAKRTSRQITDSWGNTLYCTYFFEEVPITVEDLQGVLHPDIVRTICLLT
jgi:hypothetical protein